MENLNSTLDRFMNTVGRSKVSVIVPLYGYWMDDKSKQLNEKTLRAVMDRIYSNIHDVYIFFMAEPARLPKNVWSVVNAASAAGNARGIKIENGSTYGDYIREGVSAALVETQSQFIITINPWVIVQQDALDVLIDRLNRGDDARVVSGADMRKNGVLAEEFETFHPTIPVEQKDINFDCFGMTRATAEMIGFDDGFKTKEYLEADTWQRTFVNGFMPITTQRVPIYSLEVDFSKFQPESWLDEDKQRFIGKWHFEPTLNK